VLAVGLAWAEQACLFPLPAEPHDARLDWVVTPEGAMRF
jgi:5-formyltetrahydrofolate cyclo-ligase